MGRPLFLRSLICSIQTSHVQFQALPTSDHLLLDGTEPGNNAVIQKYISAQYRAFEVAQVQSRIAHTHDSDRAALVMFPMRTEHANSLLHAESAEQSTDDKNR